MIRYRVLRNWDEAARFQPSFRGGPRLCPCGSWRRRSSASPPWEFYDVLPGSAAVLALVDATLALRRRFAAISALSLSARSRARISSQIGSQPPNGEPRASIILPICKKFRRATDGDRTCDLRSHNPPNPVAGCCPTLRIPLI
jgi:hypothetical protein